jgi:hypothetical protein
VAGGGRGPIKATGPGDDKVHLAVPGPLGFLCAIVITLLLRWALLVDAPLEEPANPTHAEPVEGALVLPRAPDAGLRFGTAWCCPFIIIGLMVIPYIDINPKGSRYYCWKDRKWEISHLHPRLPPSGCR